MSESQEILVCYEQATEKFQLARDLLKGNETNTMIDRDHNFVLVSQGKKYLHYCWPEAETGLKPDEIIGGETE